LFLTLPTEASEITIVGTAHLERLQPVPNAARAEVVVEALARWRPTLVCIEAMPGERVQEFMRDPARHGELLSTFSRHAVRLAPEQQLRRARDASAARDAARDLVFRTHALTLDEQLTLASLHLAAHEPWSAALVWSGIGSEHRAAAEKVMGKSAIEALDVLVASGNDIARIALPLARRMGHRQLCHADAFFDEVAVGKLMGDLMPMLQDPTIGKGIAEFNTLSVAHWKATQPDGLLRLLGWMQSDDYAHRDRDAQWDVFAKNPAAHDVGERRLALWHARNAEISANLYRALARPDGARVLMLIGAAHRPFLESTIAAQPWVICTPARSLLSER
jgi:hypothetical protein